MRILWAGTFDPAFARNRKLARLLDLSGTDVERVRFRLWADDRVDEARGGKLRAVLKMLTVYPRLAWTLLRTPAPDAYLVSYPGWFDLPLVALVARIKRRPVVFDPFISLFDTVIADRRMYGSGSLAARATHHVDRWSVRLADLVLADTQAHLDYFRELAPAGTFSGGVLPLGADDTVFAPTGTVGTEDDLVVFHGTFVPLQGVTTIAEAADHLRDDAVRIRVVGDGQDRDALLDRLRELGATNVEWVGLRPLATIPAEIERAAVCLGIFGTSDKAGRVVPNKLYECLAVGRPVITRDSPAIEAMFAPGEVVTVPSDDPGALADAIRRLLSDPDEREAVAAAGHRAYLERFHERTLVQELGRHLDDVVRT
jgi:glycosyltransferase involved in cell wall biosynthesis